MLALFCLIAKRYKVMILATQLYCVMYICVRVHSLSAPYCWPLDIPLCMTASTTEVCHYSSFLSASPYVLLKFSAVSTNIRVLLTTFKEGVGKF